MNIRIDRLQTAMPPPSEADPLGASVAQELLGGKFGEMSMFMNCTYQSFNFRNRREKPQRVEGIAAKLREGARVAATA